MMPDEWQTVPEQQQTTSGERTGMEDRCMDERIRLEDRTAEQSPAHLLKIEPPRMIPVIRHRAERAAINHQRLRMQRLINSTLLDEDYDPRSVVIQRHLAQMKLELDALTRQVEEYDRRGTEPETNASSENTDSILMSIPALPKAIIQARLRRNFSQEELARRANISRRTLIRYENSLFEDAPLKRLHSLARALIEPY
jgi:DNA-binding XRE family transcriptional regulator